MSPRISAGDLPGFGPALARLLGCDMDSFEWNKIIGAVLGTAIFIFVVRIVAEHIYEAEQPEKPGYVVEGVVVGRVGGGQVIEDGASEVGGAGARVGVSHGPPSLAAGSRAGWRRLLRW